MSNAHVNQAFRGILEAICKPAAQPVAQCGVEIADDQNTARDPRLLEFVATVCENNCVKCVARGVEELCWRLPCYWTERNDGRAGYFREEVRG
jgi:hypothetical protein